MNTHPSYQLLDSGNFEKLEQVGPYLLRRPSLQAIWKPKLPENEWKKAQAVFTRGKGGLGEWKKLNSKIPEEWKIQLADQTFLVRLTDFGHIGIFPEHHGNQRLLKNIQTFTKTGKPYHLLNLFAYTGAVSLAAASLGAKVVHLDASKSSVEWAKKNRDIQGKGELPIRFMVDDVSKFVAKEVRRGNRYQGIVLDPPSFGRGPDAEVWKIEEHLLPLLDQLKLLFAEDFSFLQLSAHSPGYTPLALETLVRDLCAKHPGQVDSQEMSVGEQAPNPRLLPSGASATFERSSPCL